MSQRAAAFLLLGGTVGAAGIAACDTGEIAEPRFEQVRVAPERDFASGSRLKAKYYVVDDAVAVFTTFHDAMLDVDCAYDDENGAHVGPGGTSYCFPAGMARHREGKGPYLDPFCSTLAAFTPTTGAAMYALVEPGNACITAPAVKLVKAPQTRTSYLLDDSGSCVATQPASMQAFAGDVPIETFVRATEQFEPGAGRIVRRFLVGDDGSRRGVGGWDLRRNEAVRVGLADDGTRRWLPARVAFVGGGEPLFSESACSVSVASKIARTATCPFGALAVLEGTCGLGHYFEVGPTAPAVFHRDDMNNCVRSNAADLFAFGLGAPIPPTIYEPVVATEIGTPRARRRGVGTAGDAPIAWDDVIDGQSGEPCEVFAATDGKLRCLPALAVPVVFFADEECTEPAIARTDTGCDDAAAPRFVRDSFDTPPKVFEIVRPLNRIYAQDAHKCLPFSSQVRASYFAVKEVEPSRFPAAAEASD